MFKKVLVPIDFTDETDRVIDYVTGFKSHGLKNITLAHVIDIGRATAWPIAADITGAIEARLEKRRQRLEDEGFTATSELLEGSPTDEILRLSRDGGYSMVIAGTHGKAAMEEMFLGSISESVTRKTHVPVLLLHYKLLKEISEKMSLAQYALNTFNNVLFPSDFSGEAGAIADHLSDIKNAGNDNFVTLHIVDEKRSETETENDELMDACFVNCGRISERLRAGGLHVESVCRSGDPAEQIFAFAKEISATSIVMGSHGKGLVKEWLDGSVSMQVIRGADRPLLIIHAA